MSRPADEPTAVARRFYDAFERGDWPALLVCFDREVGGRRSKRLGVETELAGADVLTLSGGVIERIAVFTDRDAARREAGL